MLMSPAPLTRPTDRLSWLWLAVGMALLPFTGWQTVLPLAAWLAPPCLLRFARTQRLVVALPLVALATWAATLVAWRNDYFGPPSLITALFMLVAGLPLVLGCLADRLLAPRLTGFPRTLAFPCTVTAVEFLMTLVNPLAAGGSLAYSQPGQLAVQQLVAVTGMWGLTFLIAWGAPAINAWWEHDFAWRPARASLLPVAVVLLATVLVGSARLAFLPPAGPPVRVAAISPNEALLGPMEIGSHQLHPGTAAEPAAARARPAPRVGLPATFAGQHPCSHDMTRRRPSALHPMTVTWLW